MLSGAQTILNPGASLGPIDSQINGIPTRALRRGFEKAREALQASDPDALPAYLLLMEKSLLELPEICQDCVGWNTDQENERIDFVQGPNSCHSATADPSILLIRALCPPTARSPR